MLDLHLQSFFLILRSHLKEDSYRPPWARWQTTVKGKPSSGLDFEQSVRLFFLPQILDGQMFWPTSVHWLWLMVCLSSQGLDGHTTGKLVCEEAVVASTSPNELRL